MNIALLDTYTDEEFIAIVKSSTSYSNLCLNLGYKSKSGDLINRIKVRFKQLNLTEKDFKIGIKVKRNIDNVFINNSTADQKTLRRWFLNGGYVEYKCSICNLKQWNEKPISLILDHINGNNKDNRLENLRWVCPNCNSQLDTTGARNIKK